MHKKVVESCSGQDKEEGIEIFTVEESWLDYRSQSTCVIDICWLLSGLGFLFWNLSSIILANGVYSSTIDYSDIEETESFEDDCSTLLRETFLVINGVSSL